MTTQSSIRIQGLHKRYPRSRDLLRFLRSPLRTEYTTALQEVDLQIPGGGIHALLGPNGAGKTTLLKLLAGLLLPDAGRLELDGTDLTGQPRRLRERVSLAVCEERSFYWRLSGRENLRFFASLNDFSGVERDTRVAACLDMVGLAGLADRRFMEYSSGMRQALALARGLLLDPAVLLMDEPTRSLDPEATLRIHDVITGIRDRHPERIILYSTHDLAEAEAISSDVIVLRKGRIVMQRSLAEDADRAYVYGLRTHPVLSEEALDAIDGLAVRGTRNDEVTIEFADLQTLDDVLELVRSRGLRILEVTRKRSTLQDLYAASGEAER